MSTVQELINLNGNSLIKATSRHGFVAPQGYAFVSLDFSSQEIVIAAWASQDEVMLRSLREPKVLPLLDENGDIVYKDGKQIVYPNPHADLHTITCKDCCFPQAFIGKPESEWVSIAKTKAAGLIKDMRFYAKITNFQILYGATAHALAEANYVRLEVAQEWLNKHIQTFKQYHQWKHEQGQLATVRGWAQDVYGRIRWVAEDNSKSAGASPARSGVNFKIQGTGATMMKLALKKIFKLLKGTKGKISIQVHDECCLILPGMMILNPEKSILDSGVIKPVYEMDEELTYWVSACRQCMVDAMSEILDGFPGGASADVAPYWAH